MRSPRSTPFSLALSRTFSILVTLATAAIGRQLLIEGTRLRQENARLVGPAGPDFSTFFVTLGGYLVLLFVLPLLWATIAVWRRKVTAAIVLAMIGLLYVIPFGFRISAPHGGRGHVPTIPLGASIGYAALLVAWALASIKAAIDLKPRRAQPPGFRTVPPPLPRPLPNFNIINDLPVDQD
jgi:hypothetical protein